jgi:hypothetical protein
MILGVLLDLYMGGHHLYTTNMVWSGHFRVDDRVYHLQVLFCFLLLLFIYFFVSYDVCVGSNFM